MVDVVDDNIVKVYGWEKFTIFPHSWLEHRFNVFLIYNPPLDWLMIIGTLDVALMAVLFLARLCLIVERVELNLLPAMAP